MRKPIRPDSRRWGRAAILVAHAPVPPVLRHAPRRPGRCRDAVAPPAAARGLPPPARLGDLLAAAARQAGQRPRRAGHPRGAGPDRRPGDGDAGRPPGRHLARERSVRRHRPGADPVQGPQRARHGPRDDPRGGRRDPARRHRQVVPPAPDDGLSLPDEVARRATGPRRADPRPRVRHEGRLQLRSRRGRARRQLRGPVRRLRADVRAARARDRRGLVRRRDHGRHRGPRVHGPQPGRRGRPRPVRGVWLRREPPGRGRPQARRRRARSRCPSRRSRRPARRPSRSLAAFLGIEPTRTAKAAFFVTGDGRLVTAIVRGDHEVNETKLGNAVEGDRRHPAGHGRGDQGRRHGAGLRLADRRPRHGRRRRRPRRPVTEPRRRREPRRASTTATSTSAATSRPTSTPTSPTPRRAIPARPAASPSSCATASRSATSSSSGRSSPTRSARRTSARTARRIPSSWARTGSASGGTSACIVEAHHDDKGIVWPAEVAPYAAHLVSIGGGQGAARHRDRRAAARPGRGRRARATRSCGTTATSRPASSSPTRSCSACPGS